MIGENRFELKKKKRKVLAVEISTKLKKNIYLQNLKL